MRKGTRLGILRIMHRYSRSVWIWSFILALITMQLGDAHMHLCFDGQEPPASLHVYDTSRHHPPLGMDETHTDKDVNVDVASAVLAKKAGTSGDMPGPIRTDAPSLLLPVYRAAHSFAALPLLPASLRWYFQPPQRGPPLQSSFV